MVNPSLFTLDMDHQLERRPDSVPTRGEPQPINPVCDWNGPDDPENPRNFSVCMRLFGTLTVTSLAFVVAFAGGIYAPAQNVLMESWGCNYETAVLPLSLYNLGLSLGPIVGAPLSERYGRKAVYVVNTPIFILFLIGGGASNSIGSLIICRFFAGVFGSPNINNASATILDYTPDIHRGVVLGMYYSIPTVGATIGPLVGGFLIQARGWRWTHWVPIIVAGILYIQVLFTRETYKGIILQRRAIRLGLLDASSQKTDLLQSFRHFFVTLIQRPIHMLCTEPIVTFVSLYNGLIYGLIYAFVISVPWVSTTYYNFDKTGEALSYLGVSLGSLIACVPFATVDIMFYQKRLLSWKKAHTSDETMPPENRLVSAMIGSFLLPVSLLIAGWTAENRVHWIIPILFQGMATLACLLVYAGANLFMLDSYGPLYGASASGAMMFSRYLLGFAFPMFTLQMFERLGAGWATSILALLTLLMAPIPWCFWVYGPRLRAASKYERSA
jgi:multidrug resistance protein